MFDESKELKYQITIFKSPTVTSYNVKYFKEIKSKDRKEPKEASMMKLFCEYTERLTIFATKAPS